MIITDKNLSVSSFASKDPQRFILNGVFLRKSGKSISIDGSMMAYCTKSSFEDTDLPENMRQQLSENTIIPLKVIPEFKKIKNKKSKIKILETYSVGDSVSENGTKKITVKTTDLEKNNHFESKTIEGNFPEYTRLFNKDVKNYEIFRLRFDKIEALYHMGKEFFKDVHPENRVITFELHTGNDTPGVILSEEKINHSPIYFQTDKDFNGQQVKGILMPTKKVNNDKIDFSDITDEILNGK